MSDPNNNIERWILAAQEELQRRYEHRKFHSPVSTLDPETDTALVRAVGPLPGDLIWLPAHPPYHNAREYHVTSVEAYEDTARVFVQEHATGYFWLHDLQYSHAHVFYCLTRTTPQ